jgi:hypothetical protein
VELENDKLTLRDLKRQIHKEIEILNYKFIIYTTGIAVQIVDDETILPNVDGRVFCELIKLTSSRKFKKQGKQLLIKNYLIYLKRHSLNKKKSPQFIIN